MPQPTFAYPKLPIILDLKGNTLIIIKYKIQKFKISAAIQLDNIMKNTYIESQSYFKNVWETTVQTVTLPRFDVRT